MQKWTQSPFLQEHKGWRMELSWESWPGDPVYYTDCVCWYVVLHRLYVLGCVYTLTTYQDRRKVVDIQTDNA